MSAEAPLSYSEFRTGITYKDVYYAIYTRKYKRRRGVLGKWREIKQKMYADYLDRWRSEQRAKKRLARLAKSRVERVKKKFANWDVPF